MKRLLLAGLIALPFALSRTAARADQEDAYVSLISMAGSAVNDRGPEAGSIPPDNPSIEGGLGSRRPSADASSAPDQVARPVKPAPAPEAKSERVKEDDAPPVSVPAAAAPRMWTRVFSALMPPMTRVTAFEVAASTSSRGARPETPRPSTPASVAGSAQGLLELVAVATAPSLEP